MAILYEAMASNRDRPEHRLSLPPGRGGLGTFAQHIRDDSDGDSGKTLRDYIEVIIRRRWLVLATFIGIFLIAAAYTFTTTPLFNSVAIIEFEEKKPKQEDKVYGNPEDDQVQRLSRHAARDSEITRSGGRSRCQDESLRVPRVCIQGQLD